LFDLSAEITLNREIAPNHHLIAFRCPEIARAAKPGQFVHARVGDCIEPLLRVPLSIHDVRGSGCREVLVIAKLLGPRTSALAQRRVGDTVDVLGPIGVPFSPRRPGESLALVGGGVGVAPLVFFAKRLKPRRRDLTGVLHFCGLRSIADIALHRRLEDVVRRGYITTDDGSFGRKGFVTDALADYLRAERVDRIIACGPMPMLRKVAQIAREHDIACEVSVERRMGCAVGVCLGCVVPVWVKGSDPPEWKYVRSCIEGPTFDARDIVWEEIGE
jgi:dihydroorotate dehydrogenase electron transfer subunit